SGMDQRAIEAAGARPLRKELDRVAGVRDAAGLVDALARLHGYRVGAGFRFGPSPDLKDSKRMIASLSQGGLGLPDRDYYLKSDDKTKAIRAGYVTHMEKMLTLLGD